MKVSIIAVALLAKHVAANKGSKAGSTSASVKSCDNYPGGLSGSKKGSKAGASSDCGSGAVEPVQCGDYFRNQHVVLQGDLYCEEGDPIWLDGQGALLDCNGFTIHGQIYDNCDDGSIGCCDNEDWAAVVLEDGASIHNCNFVNGFHAIYTIGNGCTTIDKVTATRTQDDSLRIESSGTVIMTDLNIQGSLSDAINIEIDYFDDEDLFFSIENALIVGAEAEGIEVCSGPCDDCGSGRDLTGELHGDIRIVGVNQDGLDIDEDGGSDDLYVTVFGHLSITGSGEDGIDTDDGFTLEFADGSTTTACFSDRKDDDNDDVDMDGDGIIRGDAVVICDSDSGDFDCTASCPGSADRVDACVE